MCAFSARKQRLRSIQKASRIEASALALISRGESEHLAEQCLAADCLQRPLVPRFHFRQQLKACVRLQDNQRQTTRNLHTKAAILKVAECTRKKENTTPEVSCV